MFKLNEKVALVTGASRGIGRSVAEHLAARGAHVVVGFGRNAEAADAVVKGIEAAGGKASTLGLDVGDMVATEKAIAALAKSHGRLDIMVANAGISIDGLLLRVKEPDIDRLFQVNVKGALACARGSLKSMMRARSGRIVFISSVVGEMGNPGQVAYAASKAALLGITKTLAREFASRNVTVNAVTPGFIDTDMTKSIEGDMREQLKAIVPLGRIGDAKEVAAAVTFLCSDEASYITGEVLRVNGGMYI